MKRGMIGAIALALMLVGASAVWADYDTDRRSRDARQPAEALARWLAAAHAEDKQAMLALGRMYLHGLGAPQDDVTAYMWFTLASRDGDIKALKERDALGSRMARGKRAEAEERARKWRPRTRSTIPRRASGQSPTEKQVAATSRPSSAQAVREAQRLLAKLGLAPGPVDGKWGKRATAAYRSFLRSEGRPSSDRLTVEGLELLRQSAADKNILAKRAPPSSGKNRIDLIRVVRAGRVERTKAMLRAGANPDARDMNGWTPLMHAADRGHASLISILLDARANLDIRAADGTTALFMAVSRAHEKIAEMLIDAGADISITGPNFKTPLEVAQLLGIESTAALLAKTAADHVAFQYAKKLDTAKAYNDYLASYPDGIFVQVTKRLGARALDHEAIEKARFANTAQAYREYLSEYPDGEYRIAAQQRVTQLDLEEFNQAVLADSVEAYEEYLSMNRNGKFAAEAKIRKGKAVDRGAIERAKVENTIQAYEAYLIANPNGAYRPEAVSRTKALKEPIIIAAAKSRNTVESYDAYLRSYPNGKYVEEVRRIRDRLYVVGKEFRDCPHCPQLVVVPSGRFTMGTEDGDSDEQPPHVVRISDPFAAGKYEVTVAEFRAFVQATKYDMSNKEGLFGIPGHGSCQSPRIFQATTDVTWRNPGYTQTDASPVVCVSWSDATAYVNWLSQTIRMPYRLLSETEWEYITRANTTSAFYFGDVISTDEANYNGSHAAEYSKGRKYRTKALKVGSFNANKFGVHDTHGNVMEWVEDCWHENYEGAPLDGSAWTADGNCSSRVMRGGSWYHAAPYLRSAFRNSAKVKERRTHYGFRVGRGVNPTSLVAQMSSSK